MIEKAALRNRQVPASYRENSTACVLVRRRYSLVALPYDGYRISYTLNYPGSSFFGHNIIQWSINEDNFKKEIAPCRTFSLYEEISALMDRGLLKGEVWIMLS